MPWPSIPRGLAARHTLLALLIFLPVLFGAIYSWGRHEEVLAQKIRDDLLRTTRLTTFEVEHLLHDARQLLIVLGQLPHLKDPDKRPLEAVFRRLMEVYPRYSSLILCSPDGSVLSSVPGTGSGKSLAHRDYFRRAVATGKMAGSGFLTGHLTGLPVMALALPVLNERREVEAVLVAGINLSWVSRFLAVGGLQEPMKFYAVDPEGNILLHYPDAERLIGSSFGELMPEFRDVLAGESDDSFHLHDDSGDDILVAHSPLELPFGQVHFLTVLPREVAYAELREAFRTNLLLLLGLLAATLAIARIGGNRLVVRQARSLVDVTRRIAGGDLSARIDLTFPGGGELRQIGFAFNQMAETLEERQETLLKQQRDIVRLNRVYAVLSGINGVIVRTRDREELLREACRIAVNQGGFHLVWIGFVDPDTGRIPPAAHDGQALCQLDSQEGEPEREIELGCRPSNARILQGETVVCNDLQADPELRHCLERPLFAECRSLASLPLTVDGRVVGVLSLFGSERGLFDAAEVRLLEELAADVSLGLDHIDKERQISYLAFNDLVTGLPNRDLFLDRLAQESSRAEEQGKTGAVVTVRLGRLEEMRDLHGQVKADRLLREIGWMLADTVQKRDTVGRIAAEEFGILLTEVEEDEAIPTLTDRIYQAVKEVPDLRQKELFLNLRMGVAVFPRDGIGAAGLLKNAQVAMHYPQQPAAPYHFYCREIDEQLVRRHRIEAALHVALRDAEFTAFYQPVVDIQEGRIIGAEALLRWQSRELGRVSPGEFIPVAEATGLILPLGEWVLREVFGQARRWKEAGFAELKIAANLSMMQINQPDFVSGVEALLAETGVDPRQISLALEVTETGLMENLEENLAKLHRLRDLGFELFIDDFGTGYSSLSYLKQLPFNKLKIDVSFVREVLSDEQDRILCRSIIGLAHQLGMRALAEGVETREQLAVLEEYGCDSFQGYLFSPPIPPGEFEKLLS